MLLKYYESITKVQTFINKRVTIVKIKRRTPNSAGSFLFWARVVSTFSPLLHPIYSRREGLIAPMHQFFLQVERGSFA